MIGGPRRQAGAHDSGGAPQPGPAGGTQRRSARSRWAVIAIAVPCVGMLVAGILIAVFSSPSAPPDRPVAGASAGPQATTPAPASQGSTGQRAPATLGPAVAGHGLAKGALRYPKQLRHQVLRWEAGPGGKALAAVTAQMGYAMQAAGTKLYPAMRLSCAQLAAEIQAARATPPIPDAAMQLTYGRALAGLSRAVAECQRALTVTGKGEDTDTDVDNTLLSLTRAEFAAGSKLLYRATADIRMP